MEGAELALVVPSSGPVDGSPAKDEHRAMHVQGRGRRVPGIGVGVAILVGLAGCGDDSSGRGGVGGDSSTSTASATASSSSAVGSTSNTSSSGVATTAGGGDGGGDGGASSGCPGFSEHCEGTRLCTGGEIIDCATVADGMICAERRPGHPLCVQPNLGGTCQTYCGEGLSCASEVGQLFGICEEAPYACEAYYDDRCLPDGRIALCRSVREWPEPQISSCPVCYQDASESPLRAMCFDEPSIDLGEDCVECVAFRAADPGWDVVAAAIVEVPFDSTDPQVFLDWEDTLLAPRHRVDDMGGFYLELEAGDPHAGPYDTELTLALAEAGLAPTQTHTVEAFTDPSGHALIITIAPGADAPVGSSPDATRGPIIPEGYFPISVLSQIWKEGEPYGEQYSAPHFSQPYTGDLADGASHLFLVVAGNSSSVPGVPPVGEYRYRVFIADSAGGNWTVEVPFTVTP